VGKAKQDLFKAKQNFIIKEKDFIFSPKHMRRQHLSVKLVKYLSSCGECNFMTCTNTNYCFFLRRKIDILCQCLCISHIHFSCPRCSLVVLESPIWQLCLLIIPDNWNVAYVKMQLCSAIFLTEMHNATAELQGPSTAK
jgi:hypothetical protein